MIVAGVMTLGYPIAVYHRVPPRNPLQVRWVEKDSNGSGSSGKTGLVESKYRSGRPE